MKPHDKKKGYKTYTISWLADTNTLKYERRWIMYLKYTHNNTWKRNAYIDKL